MAPSATTVVNGDFHETSLTYIEQVGNGRRTIPTDDQTNDSPTITEVSKDSGMPIAIVGMGCRLPGNVSTPDDFWELCSRARSGWSPVPKSRFNHSTFHHPNPEKIGCYNPEGGHFLDEDVALFDAPFFNVTEQEAISMDPQQRLLLECTYEALENAGIPKRTLVGQNVGVFVGGSFADYELRNCRDIDTVPNFQATGCAQSLLSNRLSYYFDLCGPSFTVDTACSSSLSALHLACQSLRSGESSQAIVASCHLNILPDYFIIMSMSSLFSNEGKSFAFDHRGSGFGRGEGAGCVILKPLDQALRDNDSIRAIVAGSGMNQDGRTKGITMPNSDAQVTLMKSIYKNFGLNPNETGYVEAHGTGTKVGDPIEAKALHEVFDEGRTKKQPLFVGSVKSNIGHLEGASGVVSVIKTAMMLDKGFVLPNCNFEAGNPKIPFDEWGIKVPTNQRPWPRGKKYASVNNFGFGGTNAHVVLERSPVAPRTLLPGTNDTLATGTKALAKRLYVLSANDKSSLAARMNDLTVYLEQRPEVFQNSLLPNLAYTLGQRRSHLAYKVAIPARGSAELIPALASNYTASSRSTGEPRIGFVFTGQGAQWHAMGRELLDAYPVFAATMGRMDRYLLDLGADFSLLDELSQDAESSRVSAAHISQPACTAVQLALTDLLKSWGIKPSAVAGHSSGEIGAAYAAGALSLESCAAIAYFRGQAIVLLKNKYPDLKGAMMAVGGSPDSIRPLIKMLKRGRVTVACMNSPSSITASGDEEAINELAAAVEAKRLFNRKLRVDTAYHSHHMELVAEEYRDSIQNIKPQDASSVAFHSSLKGCQIGTADLGEAYWVENLTYPVLFCEALQSMCTSTDDINALGVDVLLEIGPHAALEGPVKQILKSIGGNAIRIPYASALIRNKDAVDTALQLAATMFTKGVDIDFGAINFPFPGVRVPTLLTNLPRYSWNHSTKYWHQSRIAEKHTNRPFARNDLIGTLASYSNDLEPTWRNIIRADDMPWVRHHRMQNMSVYPMAGYIAMALEAASQRATLRNVAFDKFELREVTVSRPFVIHEGSDVEANITLRPFTEGTRSSSDAWDEFRIFSWAKDRSWIEHCRGLISVMKSADSNLVDGAQQILNAKSALVSKIHCFTEACKADVDTPAMYEDLTAAGAGYGPTFQGLENCRASGNYAVADLIVPDTAAIMPKSYEPDLIIHPAFLDQFIQIVWPIFGAGWKGLDVLYMPSFLQSMSLSTGITRKSGDRLRVFGTGNPTPAHPTATKLSLFATSSDSGDEALISMESLVMTPVFDRSETTGSTANRELCYKLQWEPLHAKHEHAGGADTPVSATSETFMHEMSRFYGNGVHGFSGTSGMLTPPAFEREVVIICDESTQQDLVSSLKEIIVDLTQQSPAVGSLGNVDTEGKVCIVISELSKAIVSTLSPADFHAIQSMVSSAAGILWTVRGAYTDSSNPDAQMVVGMARSVRSETLLKFATLDLGTSPGFSSTDTAEIIFEVLERTFSSDSPAVGANMEFQERNGALFVPRVVEDAAMNKFVHQETQPSAEPDLQPFHQPGRPLKIAIKCPGALDTIYFTDDLAVGTPLPDYEVEIEVKATSMNFKDIMISMGQLSSKSLGVECAGIISGVGCKVTDLKVGDRVSAMSEGAYATYTRCRGTSAQKIPDSMSFEVASTIPVVYCTAYYSLFDLGRLVKGESVLIHAAAGGVGQAAIILCQMIGAEIFATVGSVAKKEFLMSEYHIPEDHIFYSRSTSFAKAIHRATDGQGIDVVLNSLAGDALRETWDSLAHFGRFIEIGKRDITSNSRLEMARFEHNAMFASVDLTVVAAERPKTMKRLLADVFDLMGKSLVKPISPITVFPMSTVELAFRALQGGKVMGKIVIVPNADCQVMAAPRKTPRNLLLADASYVIIGGTGGLGRSMSRWMIERGARHIILLSRSGKTDGKVGELITEAETVGANIVVKSCDVANREQVEKLVSEDLSSLPPIKGVIHAAMVLEDVLFEKMTHKQWTSVVSAKVDGAWNFHHALAAQHLSFFILLSSASGAIGNRGQAAYAAANCFQNAFAQHRISLGLPASSIDLTAVSDVGHLAEGSAKRAAQVAENLGSEAISENEVLALIAAAITGKMRQECASHCITGLRIPPEAKDALFWVNDAKFAHLRCAAEAEAEAAASASASGLSSSSSSSPITSISLGTALSVARSREEAVDLICEGLMTKVSAVLMVPREEMDASKAIVIYGLDSLVAIEIRNWITRELEASLQVLELLTSGSFWALAETVLGKSKLAARFVAVLKEGREGGG
ncbi:beta-ketoacyl synthase domain-containing protein [Drepanopeziza brunnea f. sp. 'multigermtubi' MB_m1]|uniref:Beta-ketoacyl synthase domain-containing protein n=1 Tax=Marssonina brunnea f. sp. multigermtubi (strain MB_m1) TaxID=1072389 RepID=K1WVH3_MARBU|nr:beta-ketoacyl synthase domain-containing protein [Drepanopeziza brunnea f. sp. 'multigermtubi' MB_m1]EKD12633.1 beta-ketoacyl synthase domain-containing protein [Drepanopeziza brunnea f. sp. 'multigermtubi' MB_m1]